MASDPCHLAWQDKESMSKHTACAIAFDPCQLARQVKQFAR
jgi:hypothetical protein